MDANDYYKVGYILKPHGLKGEVTVNLDPEAPVDFEEVKSFFLERNNRFIPYFTATISVRGEKAFIKFEEVDSPESAQDISKRPLYLLKSSRPKSGRGNFYDDEIIGFEVTETDGTPLGEITVVTQAGPNRLLTLVHQGKEVLIPVNSPFIRSVNKTKKKITVELPEGFLDI